MTKTRFRLAEISGIPIRIDASWLLIFIWVTWSLAGNYFPRRYPSWSTALTWTLGVVTSLLFFCSVLLHELGHALVARKNGIPVKDITLFIFGGAAQISEEPSNPAREFRMAIVGPLVSLALSGAFAGIHLLTRGSSQPVAALSFFLAYINLSLGLFNLIPGFPLDGGRVLRALLWSLRRDLAWATRWASRMGQIVAYLFVALGIMRAFTGTWVDGVWLAMIGLFLDNAARTQYRQLTLRNLLEGYTVRDIMSLECSLIPPQLTLDVFVEQYLLTRARRCYAVGQGDTIMGLLTVHNVSSVAKVDWPFTRVVDVLTPLDRLRTVSPETPLWNALQHMTADGVNQLPVVVDDRLEGMITREDVIT
ncbi:MAG: site-2 protease family protein, partial [Anaerolineae bacterium]|nr:site-2 protease family protein [Anaerolineae bacterium]